MRGREEDEREREKDFMLVERAKERVGRVEKRGGEGGEREGVRGGERSREGNSEKESEKEGTKERGEKR